jgi:hypothetical protein
MKTTILLILVLITLLFTKKIYLEYISKREKKIIDIRLYIYKRHKEIYIFLPSTNLMTYNLIYPTTLEFWINYGYSQKRKQDYVQSN